MSETIKIPPLILLSVIPINILKAVKHRNPIMRN